MKNREFYRDEIINYKGENFCEDFMKPKVLESKGIECETTACSQCHIIVAMWLEEEYQESKVDWSKVGVDTPIWVRGTKESQWEKRHFAMYENGKVYAWSNGNTSWSVECDEGYCWWRYAELAGDK